MAPITTAVRARRWRMLSVCGPRRSAFALRSLTWRMQPRELALFAGHGGGLLGSILLGWRTVCAVEIDPFCIAGLLRRQSGGMLDRFPIWDDVRSFDGRPWRGSIDVISGGFPCQGISAAGSKLGLADVRSGLWSEYARIIGEVRPRKVFIENSPHLRTRGLVTVLQDLAVLGYGWTGLEPLETDRFQAFLRWHGGC